MRLDSSTGTAAEHGALSAEDSARLIRLLARGLSHLAVAAQGIDEPLDEHLSHLRQILRSDPRRAGQLAAVIDAIDDRIRRVDEDRERRISELQQVLERLAASLLALRPERPVARELKSFLKTLSSELGEGDELSLLARLAVLQETVLAGVPRQAPGLFARWFGDRGEPAVPAHEEQHRDAMPATDLAPSAAAEGSRCEAEVPAAGEPPFSRISASVCAVLMQLLRQLDPPPIVADSHRRISERVAAGLNWYELVSVLEETSLVVLAVQDRDRSAFQQFLLALNRRLAEAHLALEGSLRAQAEQREAGAALGNVVRDQVAAIQASVTGASELEQLKAEVCTRLDSIVSAMDHQQHLELSRQQVLEQQLIQLTERMREMEVQSAQAEARLEEQRQLALADPLTQLPNRQAYEERLQLEYQRWLRYRRPLALVICDVDNFKGINDTFGHLAGDKVLRILARTLRTRLRQTDFVARFGGEEFVVLMPETSEDDALKTMNGIRTAIGQCPFHFRSQPVSVTLSAGIAEFCEDDHPESVFERADAALYRAKQAGRNCCFAASCRDESPEES